MQTPERQQELVRNVFEALHSRADGLCNFVEDAKRFGKGVKLIYRHFATLYFAALVDENESELGILDLIHVFVETLDSCFENVCELDLIFHSDRVHYILDEIVMAGMVLDTNINNVLKATRDMTKLHQKSLSKLNDLVQSSPSRLSPSQRAAGHQGGSPF